MATLPKKGQSLVEFALVLTIFLMILLSIIDWGLYLYASTIYESAVRDAVRSAVTFSDWQTNYDARLAEINATVTNRTSFLPANLRDGIIGRTSITFDPNIGNADSITVTIANQPFTPITGFLGNFIPQVMNARATMRYEWKN